MSTIAFVPHRLRPRAIELVRSAASWLEGEGHQVRVPKEDASATGLEEWSVPESTVAEDLDLAVSLGGDGTMLRTVDLVCNAGVPVLGVNVGHLGYLTEAAPGDLEGRIRRFLAGDFTLDKRATLDLRVEAPSWGVRATDQVAFNEIVLEKTLSGHTAHLAVCINRRPFLTYATDGLIIATPTGSTAYNLSARGPIMSPGLRAFLLTPVSPHMLFDRSLVLDPDDEVSVEVIDGREAAVVLDGTMLGRLAPGDRITARVGKRDAHLVTFETRHFHDILKTKFGLADR